jgi:exoribonuclease R
VKILVAVADVDAIVKEGSAIDGHARTNTTSVYTAAEIFPMLPERLSTDLTSLNEGQVRLAIVIEMGVAADGTVAESDVYRAVVMNRAKLAYNGIAAWLDGTAPAPPRLAAVPGLDEQLHIQDRAAQAMKSLRHQHGALRLETLETRAVFDGDVLTDLLPDEKNRAKELIEDFMIAANGVTAKYLERKGFPSLRRVLRSPDRWERIVELATRLGRRLPPKPSACALEEFLDELNGLARHCTEQEDIAAKAERQVEKSAAALLLASRIGERFEAIVTGASEKGTWVRILRPAVEGKVVRGFEGLDVGDRVRVEITDTNVERGFIEFVRLRREERAGRQEIYCLTGNVLFYGTIS